MNPNFGQTIYDVRKSMKLTQQQFADKVGIGISSLRRYESNERQPSMETLSQIAARLDMDLGTFLWGSQKDIRQQYALEVKLRQIGFTIGGDDSEGYLFICYPDGELSITEKDLIDLNNATNEYLKFKLEELKQKRFSDFRYKHSE